MSNSPLDKFLKAHKLSCASRRLDAVGKPCSCGRDEAIAQLADLRSIKQMLCEALIKSSPWHAQDDDPLSLKQVCLHCGVEMKRGVSIHIHPNQIHKPECVWLCAFMEVTDGDILLVPPHPTPLLPNTTGGI